MTEVRHVRVRVCVFVLPAGVALFIFFGELLSPNASPSRLANDPRGHRLYFVLILFRFKNFCDLAPAPLSSSVCVSRRIVYEWWLYTDLVALLLLPR